MCIVIVIVAVLFLYVNDVFIVSSSSVAIGVIEMIFVMVKVCSSHGSPIMVEHTYAGSSPMISKRGDYLRCAVTHTRGGANAYTNQRLYVFAVKDMEQ